MDLEALGQLELRGADGEPHRLSDYLAAGPVVLVFLRHFG